MVKRKTQFDKFLEAEGKQIPIDKLEEHKEAKRLKKQLTKKPTYKQGRTDIKIVFYNNKSRKGLYYYTKQKGKPASLIKKDKLDKWRIPNKDRGMLIAQYYQDRIIKKDKKATLGTKIKAWTGKKKTGLLPTKKIPIKRLKLSQTKISQIIKAGISTVKIEDIKNKTENQIKAKLDALLTNSIKDKQIREIMTTETNMIKIANRIECIAIIKNNKGEKLTQLQTIGIKTPRKVIQELTQEIKEGREITENSPQELYTRLTSKGYNRTHVQEGLAHKIDLLITFRKA